MNFFPEKIVLVIRDPEKPIPDPGSLIRGQKGTGFRIRTTGKKKIATVRHKRDTIQGNFALPPCFSNPSSKIRTKINLIRQKRKY